MAKARFTLAETMIVLTTLAVTLGAARALGIPLVGQVVCAVVGLACFAMLILSRRNPPSA